MGNKLITKIEDRLSYLSNDLTKEMDTYLVYQNSEHPMKTYIYDKFKDKWTLRFPGATRGYIKVDENEIITEIVLYDDTVGIYKPEVRECFDKYIGMQIEIKNNLPTNRDFYHKASKNIAAAMLEHIEENNGRVNNE